MFYNYEFNKTICSIDVEEDDILNLLINLADATVEEDSILSPISVATSEKHLDLKAAQDSDAEESILMSQRIWSSIEGCDEVNLEQAR